ncbi:uncharacterized protein LOC115878832 isoform X2 [Sitophilus oryzae]|uniref:Uncharacterized protein LOC115878832 isoform X2 n=1 Tax=Sitophilus oryzae TaxID=7048 RepID=A0A6J2XJN3_SITOR|nr:uncharacterized protein LOC115878832 isoform X2 [Sitophilus oryzae]
MSGKMFSTNHSKTPESRIPVPSSPVPFRRHNSLRLKGEVGTTPYVTLSKSKQGHDSVDNVSIQERGRHVSVVPPAAARPSRAAPAPSPNNDESRQSANNPRLLRRGRSFMERGESRDGGKSTPMHHRPASVKITTKPPTGLGKVTLNSPQSPGRIRSLSLSLSSSRLSSPKSPSAGISNPVSPAKNHSASHLDSWETDSITSIGSSVASCDHASVARNGTTFSGRSMKYVFHCNQHSGVAGDDYLTPTQRAHRQVKKLKHLLHQAKKDLEQKDSDILKLTKEVVELRLYKAALSSPEDKSNSSDAVTVRENASEETTPDGDVADLRTHLVPVELNSSFADSGHFDDGTNSSIHSNDDYTRSPYKSKIEMSDKSCSVHMQEKNSEQSKLIIEYEKRIQELIRAHEEETYHLKQKHNDKVEELLLRITEINARYWELVPELDAAKEKIKELESQLEQASKKLEEQESHAKQTYLKMYSQGQAAARMEQENAVMEIARQHPNRVSVPELLNELQVTKNELENIKAMYRQLMEAKSKNKIDPEITLQFLRSAIYYFLTDKENNQGHLKAIQSILGFTETEIANIDKARLS